MDSHFEQFTVLGGYANSGGIYLNDGLILTLKAINFTSAQTVSFGSVFLTTASSRCPDGQYLTIVRCEGDSMFTITTSDLPVFKFGNCYDNQPNAAIWHCQNVGAEVTSFIFSGTEANKICQFSGSSMFHFTNCIFSVTFPPTYALTMGCVANCSTSSHTLTAFSTFYCPISPTSARTNTPTGTSSRPVSRSPTATASRTATISKTPSAARYRTVSNTHF
jgi:hypothetical protein